jgi:succinate dehydrogenase/fumarate reductase cytochrome b subunit
MIKYFLSIISISAVLTSSAQIREVVEALKPKKVFTGEPIIKKKSQHVTLTAGVPNNIAQFLNFGGFGSFFSTAKSGTGPFFIRYEYLVKDNIGIGASVSYAHAEETYKNPFGSGTVTGNITGFSILLSTYYHFYTTNKFDTYTKGSIGLNIWSGSYKDQNNGEVQKFTAPTPVAYHAILGIRYFVTPHVNLTGDIGYSNLKFSAGIGVGLKLK